MLIRHESSQVDGGAVTQFKFFQPGLLPLWYFVQKPRFHSKTFTRVLHVSKTVFECVLSQHQWWSDLTNLSLRYLGCFDQGLVQDTCFHEMPLLSLLPITSNLPAYDCLGTEAPGRANELVQKHLLSEQNMLRRHASSERLNSLDGIRKSVVSFIYSGKFLENLFEGLIG